MTITPDNDQKTLTLQFETNEWTVLQEAQQRQPGAFRTVVVDWLKNIKLSMIELDRKLVADKISTLTPAQLQQIKTLLGL